MDPIEQRVRESLRARAEDAEPTPSLYRGVQDRIAKRRRAKLLAWVPAGAAALGIAVAVPILLADDPGVPNIEDYAEEQPASATTPDRAVIVDENGELQLLDLTDGSLTHTYAERLRPEAVPEIDVAPSERSRIPSVHAAVAVPMADRPEEEEVLSLGAHWVDASGKDRATMRSGSGNVVGGRFAVSPDGRWLASLLRMEDADGWSLQLQGSPTVDGDTVQIEPGIVVPAGSVIQEWAGPPVRARGPASVVTILNPDGQLLGFPLSPAGLEGTDEIADFGWIGERVESPVGEREVAAYASSHLSEDADGGPAFVLETVGDGAVVQAVDGRQVLGQVDVSDLVGGQDPSTFAVDAWGDTAALSTPDGSWLLTHDGDGAFGDPVALPEGTVRAALVGKADVVAAPEEAEEPAPAPEPEEETPPAEEPTGPTADTMPGEGMVVADDRTVTLVRPAASAQELVTFPAEGESTVVAVAVRPGSTVDDLTVAITTRAEGEFDVRWLRLRDGEVDTSIDPDGTGFPAPPIQRDGQEVFASPDLQDGGVPAPVWSLDGDLLAVVSRTEPGAAAEVRTIGWNYDDGPSDDPNLAASFELDTDRPLTARQWVWTGDAGEADGAVREGQLLMVDDLAREAFSVRLDRGADGAPGMPAQNPPVEPVEEEGILDIADLDLDGTIDAVLRGVDSPALELLRGGGQNVLGVPLARTGPREANFIAGSRDLILVVLDPAQPVLVDPETTDLRPLPLDGEVVAADLIR